MVNKSGGTAVDENFYAAAVHSLLKSATPDDFNTVMADMFERWSPAFHDYYTDNIHSAVTASAASATSHLDIVRVPYVGITNNVSESYNRVLKDFQNWKVNKFSRINFIFEE